MKIFSSKLLFIFLFLGLLLRLHLVYSLPLWRDEASSILASQSPFLTIISGSADPGHPPGYHLFLKIYSFLGNHLIWMRLSSVFFFVINVYLLNKIGSKLKGPIFSLFLVFLYIFSGYFMIFDWQVRMYTGITTLMLFSLFSLLEKKLFLFTLTNTIGLYFDYGFLWYFMPLFPFFLSQALIKKNVFYRRLLLSITISTICFLIWLPFFLKQYQAGIDRISWIKPYLSPFFFIPFFLGTHSNYALLPLFLTMALFGLAIFLRKKQNKTIQLILFSAIFSFTTTLFYSTISSPIFHVRSLQIVAMAIIFLFALAIYWLHKQKQYYLILAIVLFILINFFFIYQALPKKPGQFLISFFPWRQVKNEIDKRDINYVVFKQTNKLLSDKLIWGLKYTLDGKESFPIKKVPYKDIFSTPNAKIENCKLISNSLVDIYGCR